MPPPPPDTTLLGIYELQVVNIISWQTVDEVGTVPYLPPGPTTSQDSRERDTWGNPHVVQPTTSPGQ